MKLENPSIRRRRIVQWTLAPLVLITIGLGWKYPIFGFSVPIVMLMGMIGGVFAGRYVCGNLCPRGGFFDRMVAPISPHKPIPAWFRSMPLRIVLMVALMGLMAFQVSRDPSNWRHWGRVFWLICTVTTAVGVVLGLFIHQRSWCSFCPMGTMQNLFGRWSRPLKIDPKLCRECHACEKVCPVQIKIVDFKASGMVSDPDCLKCDECVAVCPVHALSWGAPTKSLSENLIDP